MSNSHDPREQPVEEKPYRHDKIFYHNGIRLLPKGWLPNQKGFRFVAHLSNGGTTVGEVVRDEKTQLHSFIGFEWEDFIGWTYLPKTK